MADRQQLREDWPQFLVNELGLSMSTALTYEHNLRRLERTLGKDPCDLDVNDVRRFMRETDYHPSTKNGVLVALKAFRRFGLVEGALKPNGIEALRGPKQHRDTRPSLDLDEVRTVLDACRNPNDFRLVYLGLYAGCRVSEAASIYEREWAREDRLRFMGKGSKTREIPVHPELARQRVAIMCSRTTRGSLNHTCRSLRHYTRIDFTPHTLRRSFGVHLSETGIGRDVIGALLGHAPSSVTEVAYVPVRFSEMIDAINRLNYLGERNGSDPR